jgi:hypothetical protein
MPSARRIEAHRGRGHIGQQRVCRRAGDLGHRVLEESVDDDHVPARSALVETGHLLANDRPHVRDELEVEVGDAQARVALAGRGWRTSRRRRRKPK